MSKPYEEQEYPVKPSKSILKKAEETKVHIRKSPSKQHVANF